MLTESVPRALGLGGGLNETVSHGPHILTLVPSWWRCFRELLGDMALLEEGLQWELALRVYSLGQLPVCSLH